MTTVSFPITLTGTYTDGSVCSAADYRADFEKMRDAINHMHERFSTLIFTGHDITYQDNGKSYLPSAGADDSGFPGTGTTTSGARKKILNVMKIPSWMQGIRVRGLELCNFSRLPAQADSTWGDEPIYYMSDTTNPLKFGIAYADTLTKLSPASWSATDISSITLDTDAKVRGPYQFENSGTVPLKTPPVFADGTGYASASSNVVVPPGNYIAIYSTGKVWFSDDAADQTSTKLVYDLNWHFAVNALCDAMVPVL